VGTAAFLAWKGMSGGTPVQALALSAAIAYLGVSMLASTWVEITPDTVRIRPQLPVAWRRAIPRGEIVSVQLAPVGSLYTSDGKIVAVWDADQAALLKVGQTAEHADTIKMQASRSLRMDSEEAMANGAAALSPKRAMPASAVPTAPMPVHTA
jgi:hypothetical protein